MLCSGSWLVHSLFHPLVTGVGSTGSASDLVGQEFRGVCFGGWGWVLDWASQGGEREVI